MKEWYLMSQRTRPNHLGGFENQGFLDFKDDAFSEALDTDMADTVILYNHDLSESMETRCIVQGRVADTQLKSFERTFLFPIGTAVAGMYVYYEDVYWLITGYNGNNKIYEKLTGTLCVYKLRWQNSVGDIVERWITATSAAKYDVGENENNNLTITSNTMIIQTPLDEDCLDLDMQRVFIDIREKNPTKVYKITRDDDVPYNFGGSHQGILSFIADKTELDKVKDNQELRICNYFEPKESEEPETPPLPTDKGEIVCYLFGRDTIKLGSPREYEVTFTDKEGKELDASDVEYQYHIESEFADKIEQSVDDGVLTLRVTDENLAYERFLLQVLVGYDVVEDMWITIEDIY